MPELPEVETIVRGLTRRVMGWVVASVHLGRSDIVHGHEAPLCAALSGERIVAVGRQGKLIRLGTGRGFTLYVHLGMTGRLTITDRDKAVARHTHLRITFRRRQAELRFCDPRRFGGIWLVRTAGGEGGEWFGRRLPPAGVDPLQLSTDDMQELLAGRRRGIKSLLLGQRPIAGLGNIYVDEALHRAGIHPLSLAGDLGVEGVRRLHRSVRRVLGEAIAAGGSSISDYRTADDKPGSYQRKHRVYGRAGRPCRKCGRAIERLTVAGRSTFVCPGCQRRGAKGT